MEQSVFHKMLEEFKEVNDRAAKLRNFILDGKFTEVDNLNKDLLIAQLKAMEAYLSVLSIRIGLNSPKDAEEPTMIEGE